MPIAGLLTRVAVTSVIAICSANRADAETAAWLFRTDFECRWNIDGESKGVLHLDDRVRVTLELGEHLIEAVPTAGGPRWEQIINVKDTTAQVFTISLVAAKTAPSGGSAAEELSRAKAALRTLADNIEACPERPFKVRLNSKPNPKNPLDQPYFSGPKNVVWDFSPSKGLPSPYTGYIEFSIYMFFRAPLEAFNRFRRDYPVADYVLVPGFSITAAGVAYMPGRTTPTTYRYEFDLGAEGVALRKALSRISPDPWGREPGPVGCEADAFRKAGIPLDNAK